METGGKSTGITRGPTGANIVYIRVGNGSGNSLILWYEDKTLELKVDDSVEFDRVDATRTKPLNAAVGVRKVGGKIIGFSRKSLLPQIALLASALLIIAVSIDIRR